MFKLLNRIAVVTLLVTINFSLAAENNVAEKNTAENNVAEKNMNDKNKSILSAIEPEKSTAVFYGSNLPTDILSQYSRIIVEPDNVKAEELKKLRAKDGSVFAYVSIGEVSPTRKWYKYIKKDWILGDNKVWDSKVMDLASPGWQKFILDSVVTPLWNKGYRGLFFDTMDSFYLFAKDEKQQKVQIDALVSLLKKIHERYPDMRFISNRGFEVAHSIGDQLEAVLAESLFSSWDNVNKVYKETTKNDQEWLTNKLNSIKKDLSIDIIIIDYSDPSDPKKMKELATRIAKEGFIPWISIASLDIAGLGTLQLEPKVNLLLVNTAKKTKSSLKKYQSVFTKLKEKGESVKIHDVLSGLPIGHLVRRYASVMTALPFKQQSQAYKKWLKNQIKEGVKFIPLNPEAKVKDGSK